MVKIKSTMFTKENISFFGSFQMLLLLIHGCYSHPTPSMVFKIKTFFCTWNVLLCFSVDLCVILAIFRQHEAWWAYKEKDSTDSSQTEVVQMCQSLFIDVLVALLMSCNFLETVHTVWSHRRRHHQQQQQRQQLTVYRTKGNVWNHLTRRLM